MNGMIIFSFFFIFFACSLGTFYIYSCNGYFQNDYDVLNWPRPRFWNFGNQIYIYSDIHFLVLIFAIFLEDTIFQSNYYHYYRLVLHWVNTWCQKWDWKWTENGNEKMTHTKWRNILYIVFLSYSFPFSFGNSIKWHHEYVNW